MAIVVFDLITLVDGVSVVCGGGVLVVLVVAGFGGLALWDCIDVVL